MSFVCSSADLGDDKAGGWARLVGRVFAPVDLSVGDASQFNGTWVGSKLGSLGINHIATTCERAARTSRHIAADRSTSFVFVLVKRGTLMVEQFNRECELVEGSYALHYSGAPFRYYHNRPTNVLCMSMPADCFSSWLFDPTRVCGIPRSGESGMAKVTLDFIRSAAGEANCISEEAGYRCGTQISQLLEVLFEAECGDTPVGKSAVRTALFRRAKDVIHSRLHDVDLSPQSIADAMGISVRYLHRIFQDAETTVGEVVRERRLNSCCERLADPKWSHIALKQIGASAGFSSQAHFTHAFRRRYGLSPSDYREEVRRKMRSGLT